MRDTIMDTNINIAQRLKELRKQHGYTQAELGKMLDLTPTAISTWERGASKPRMDVIYKMAQLYNVTPGDIVGQTESLVDQFDNLLSQNQIAVATSIDPDADLDDEALENIKRYVKEQSMLSKMRIDAERNNK